MMPLNSDVGADPAEILRLAERIPAIAWKYGAASRAEIAAELGVADWEAIAATSVCVDDRLVEWSRHWLRHPSAPDIGTPGSLLSVTTKGLRKLAREQRCCSQ